jgi:hypothetical protein
MQIWGPISLLIDSQAESACPSLGRSQGRDCAEEGKPFAFALTQAKANALSAHGRVAPSVMHDRVDYAASMTDGRTVQETDPRGRSAAEAANLWELLERLHESTKGRSCTKKPAALSAGLVAVSCGPVHDMPSRGPVLHAPKAEQEIRLSAGLSRSYLQLAAAAAGCRDGGHRL